MLISVCMCTYKRTHLEKTLISVENLELPKNTKLEVIVVDNDIEQSAHPIVSNHARNSIYQCHYISEPMKNISIARNAYLQAANGQWIASLDDDEIADSDWLSNLLKTADEFDSQVVFGVVKPIFPTEVPCWIEQGEFFVRKEHRTGTNLTSGGAGCTLASTKVFRDHDIKFDKSYGLSGGEDAELFYRIYKLGYRLTYCREAFVSEAIEPHRLTGSFLTKRAFRIGQTYTSYRLPKNADSWNRTKYFAILMPKVCLTFFLTLVTLPFGKKHYFKHWLKLCDILGKTSVVFGTTTVELYN
ncbi:glycosyltransferase family 2 protein [Vibrio amylolyticus]|uniref:glycosyltransferase family 2 protein n=1 Tax=Vibrio amylolyticus TaxID=2847292 RepID=UPI00354DE421